MWIMMNLSPIRILLFHVLFCSIINIKNFLCLCFILFNLISVFSVTRYLLVPYGYVSVKSFDLILFLSCKLQPVVITSSVIILSFQFYIFDMSLILFYCVYYFFFYMINSLFTLSCFYTGIVIFKFMLTSFSSFINSIILSFFYFGCSLVIS